MKKKTKEVKIGGLGVGGGNPVRIKGMLKSSLQDKDNVIREARRLEREGAEAIRVAVEKRGNAKIARILKKNISVPLAADVHFDYRLALDSIESGFDQIRLNPLNIYRKKEVREVVKELKKSGISLRVGINSGGFKKDFPDAESIAKEMVKIAADYLNIIEKEGFFDIMVSLKTSSIDSTFIANKEFRRHFDYPLHLGVTATGPFLEGIVKSSLGVGMMLSSGAGDIIRISLTGPSWQEIRIARYLLQSLGLRSFSPEVISCPTCSRCNVDLPGIVDKLRKELSRLDNTSLPGKIAVMGCVVNGPGEAYQADIGLAFGKKRAAIFKKDKIVGWTDENNALRDLIDEIGRMSWK
ncbi:MAG: 4-hydroxy-3-methylbut-2-en-1-yl diphosphate synthase [Candidatus Omnitrophica bacterium 4484_171]|nr:MAG: 4-hydroxy-3-methylbut-2-en-1-yl diphosphate synthase [Candidatus Omnitrophica bacterium 4484_171]